MGNEGEVADKAGVSKSNDRSILQDFPAGERDRTRVFLGASS
jgi:hypothetical protein